MRADLHVHSNASDGTDPPAEVMRRAAAAGLDAVALTDHDTVAGLAAVGLAGVEVFHPDQSDSERTALLALSRDLALLASGGSDDHGRLTGHRIGTETAAAGVYEALVAASTGNRPVRRG